MAICLPLESLEVRKMICTTDVFRKEHTNYKKVGVIWEEGKGM